MFTSSISLVDILTFVVAIVLPLVNGFLTKQSWSSAAKGLALAILSGIVGILSELINSLNAAEAYDIGVAALKWGAVFVIAVASYFGILSRPLSSTPTVELTPVESEPSVDLSKLTKAELLAKIKAEEEVLPAIVTVEQPKSIASIVADRGIN